MLIRLYILNSAELLQQKLYGCQNLKYLLLGPLRSLSTPDV